MEKLLLKAVKLLASSAPALKGQEKEEPEKISNVFIKQCIIKRMQHCYEGLEKILFSEQIYADGIGSKFHIIADPVSKRNFNIETYEVMEKLLKEEFETTEDIRKLDSQQLTYIIKGALLVGAKTELEIKTIREVFLTYEWKTWNEYVQNK